VVRDATLFACSRNTRNSIWLGSGGGVRAQLAHLHHGLSRQRANLPETRIPYAQMMIHKHLVLLTSASICQRAGLSVRLLTRSPQPVALQPGESRVTGTCLVMRTGDSLCLERAAEPGNVQSEWDCKMGRAPDYAGTMADMALLALSRRPKGSPPARVLLLGLGGGTIAGQILCDADWALQVTALEADADVAKAAEDFFFPAMFEQTPNPAHFSQRLRVVLADASRVVHVLQGEEPFDVVVEDFAYQRYGRLSAEFWRSLRRLLIVPGGTLLVNTLYPRRSDMDALAHDLRAAGWRQVEQKVDRGLQTEDGDEKRPRPHEWRPRDNMIFSAVNSIRR
jgi:hypothetical protein